MNINDHLKNHIQFMTDLNKRSEKDAAVYALNLLSDPERKERLKQNLCKICFYRGSRICGQAFTSWKCRSCSKEDTYSNTCVPHLCNECAKSLKCCTDCCAKV